MELMMRICMILVCIYCLFCASLLVVTSVRDARPPPLHDNIATKYAREKKKAQTEQRVGSNLHKPQEDQWIINFPDDLKVFHRQSQKRSSRNPTSSIVHQSVNQSASLPSLPLPGNLVDVRVDSDKINKFEKFTREVMPKVDLYTDGESIDAIEHFFWGMENGISIELGALDGSPFTHSQTYDHELYLGWKRILIEANPTHRYFLKKRSSAAFSAIAPICNSQRIVHYAKGLNDPYTGGIIEFMTPDFMKKWHHDIYKACRSADNKTSCQFNVGSSYNIPKLIEDNRITPLQCMPLSHILNKIQVKHVNLFILDVEGAEFDILKSVNWENIIFDVICVETNGERPTEYSNSISKYLSSYGYRPIEGGGEKLRGRNSWFIHQTFVPQKRPGLAKDCFNGVEKSIYSGEWMKMDGKIASFVPCKLEDGFNY